MQTYWCAEAQAWLRFDMDRKGDVDSNTVEIAEPDDEHPSMAAPWKKADANLKQGFWTLYDAEEQRYFYLKAGKLYQKDGIDKWTEKLRISEFDGTHWRRSRETLEGFTLADTPPAKLPMTPEQQQRQWKELQSKDLASPYLAGINSKIAKDFGIGFTEQQYNEIASFLPTPLLGQRKDDFSDVQSYLKAYKDAITDENNIIHQQIAGQASRTFDYTTLEGTGIDIPTQTLMKKQLFFHLLTAEYNEICNVFGLSDKKLAYASYARPRPQGADIRQELIPQDDFFNLQQCQILFHKLEQILADFFNTHFAHTSDYCGELNQVIQNQEHEIHKKIETQAYDSFLTENQELNPEKDESLKTHIKQQKKEFFLNLLQAEHDLIAAQLLYDLKKAVAGAQTKYASWYAGQSDAKRGNHGFFTWARHGRYGQNRACELKNKIEGLEKLGVAIGEIQSFLTDSKTRYHRHSFASFLLDELTKHDGLPWHAINKNSGKKYNKNDLLNLNIRQDIEDEHRQNQLSH
ncbi:hypothetical protein [Legionella londiniensis]|uniref:Uncharacterized protein n=1 Tax=Legionella londiniensis TaxID=45068 RepID=A0A0W0VP03_9GAMM|nr:hypothetical protein [Legionella londiniensis]KTD21893.1 hypothetical protein Llon_1058 [Legionella londiniensis]STX92624.1 Uncharacterised protein [Legionella londiniensis]